MLTSTTDLLKDDPYLKLSPCERETEHRQRRARFKECAVPDRPMRLLSASERSAEALATPRKKFVAARVVTVDEAFAMVWPWIPAEPRAPQIKDVQRAVAGHYDIARSDLLSARRTKEVVWPRQVGMYLAKELTPHSLPEIGRRFGNRDHTTVLHAVRKIGGLVARDEDIAAEMDTIKRLVKQVTA